ncbi:Uncharacterized peptidase U32 family member YhbV [hydrothermal vent metagenome]|uniref:Uncharacterized peptidase U32 family member YhbV n=1 Tax=hydrothermal vent metagenome TaxID=652676 RepID=A0A3B0ZDN8_9ZZZZ
MNGIPATRLSLGPVPYYWGRGQLLDFYRQIAKTSVDIIYLGETVCAKRRALCSEDWLALARTLKEAGKEIVLSSMTLIEAGSELGTLKRLCDTSGFCIEANDMAAVQLLSGKTRFVTGPSINIYNHRTLEVLADHGLKRWVLPVELSRTTLSDLQQRRPIAVETEVFAYGRLPLAYSARCFTARAHNLPKDDCQFRCLDYPDGLLLSTREDEAFLTLNGIQTQSAKTCNLVKDVDELVKLGVDVLRISPQSRHTERVIEIFRQTLNNTLSAQRAHTDLLPLAPEGYCDGYWHGTAGMTINAGEEVVCH